MLRRLTAAAAARAFVRSEQGSIAPLFALSIFLVFGAVGLGIDSARGYGAKQHIQNSVDAAMLAAARRAAEQPSANVEEVFTRFFYASKPEVHDTRIREIRVRKDSNTIEARVKADLPSLFMSVLGHDRMQIEVEATVEFGLGDVELVLALDNTASMAGSKIATLKTAAKDLVDSLSRNTPTPEKLRLGIVPFAQYVNVGLDNRNASWMDVATDYTETTNWCRNEYPNATSSNCRMVSGPCTRDGMPASCTWQECDTNNGIPVWTCSPSTNSYVWRGCVRSRAYPLNVQDAGYSTRIPGLLNAYCPSAIKPLTTSRDVIRDAIDAMAPDGDTYIPEGLMWGWRMLSPQAPFGESQSGTNTRVRRFMVVMTDGVNSVSPTSSDHSGTDVTQANAYTQEACTNIKADGITIFTVAFEVGDNSIKNILRNCASANSFFFDATSNSELLAAFNAIGQQLVDLRIKR